MKIHRCARGFQHVVTEREERMWMAVPEALREALVQAHTRIADAEERDGWAAGERRDLVEAQERAIEALEAHPSTRGFPFRLMAMIEAEGRADRCVRCYRRRSEQLSLLPVDPDAPQDEPPPPPRPPAPELPPPSPRRAAPAPPAPPRPAPPAPPRTAVLPTPEAAALARATIERLRGKR